MGKRSPVINDTFVTGDPRVMENPELTALTTLFMREHNFWAGTLKAVPSEWTGDLAPLAGADCAEDSWVRSDPCCGVAADISELRPPPRILRDGNGRR
jgi:hypothetical protein